jgi:transcriptional regulator with XRE-family HTH domain
LNNLGQTNKETCEKHNLLFRQVAANLDLDTELLSKVERAERNRKREQVLKLALLLKIAEEELISLWFGTKIIDVIGNEKLCFTRLKIINKLNKNDRILLGA